MPRKSDSITIKILDNGSKALLRLNPDKDDKIKFSDIQRELKRKGIVHGIKAERIRRAMDRGGKVDFFPCAEWTPPKPGKDSAIEYLISEEPEIRITEDGRVDHYNRGYFKEVEEGQPLARKIPPTEGEDGIAVTGGRITAEAGFDLGILQYLGGGGVRISPRDDDLIIAARSGIYSRKGKKIDVKDGLTVPGSLDFKYGNIRTSVSVMIYGDVMSGFKVESSKNVMVAGAVENSAIRAGGDLRIEKGIAKGDAPIIVKGRLITNYIAERINLRAGEIQVKNTIQGSIVSADKSITARKIVGGKVNAGGWIKVEELGNRRGTPTFVELGLNQLLLQRLNRLKQEAQLLRFKKIKTIEALFDAKSKLEEASAKLEERIFNSKFQASEHILKKLEVSRLRAADEVQKRTEKLDLIRDELEVKFNEIEKIKPDIEKYSPFLEVSASVYPKVTVRMGLSADFETSMEMSNVKFYLDEDNEVIVETLNSNVPAL